jgi:undecaprenyl-diphosphatase
MSFLNAIILGLVQGLTEFLPVSSSGHLVILQSLFGMDDPQLGLDILLHTGTLMAIIIYYRSDVIKLLSATVSLAAPTLVREDPPMRRLVGMVVVSSVPTFILGYVIAEKSEWIFASPVFSAWMLLITGTLLMVAHRKRATTRLHKDVGDTSIKDSVLIGIAQGLSVLPGISRSGATISAGLLLGFKREEAVRYSFLVALPAMLGALVWSLKSNFILEPESLPAYVAGTIVAFLVGYAALKKLITITIKGRLHFFSYYCWGLGALVLAVTLLR